MSNDLSEILSGWVGKDDRQSARVIHTYDGRTALQYFEANAVLQMEIDGRPDGVRPGGFGSILEMLNARLKDSGATISAQDWMELDREFVQHQQRRQAALVAAASLYLDNRPTEAVGLYALAVRDLKHCIDIIDLTVAHHPTGTMVSARPEIKPVLIGQRFLALAQFELANGNIEAAVELLRDGESQLQRCIDSKQPHDEASTACLRELTIMESAIRDRYKVKKTLREQLDDALAGENYELAASLRDRLSTVKSTWPAPSEQTPG